MKALAAATAVLLCACTLPQGLRSFDPARSAGYEPEPGRSESPPSARELIAEGDRMRDSGNVSRAAWSYLRALRTDPSRRSPRERIGYLHLIEGDAAQAQTTFEVVLSATPDSGPAAIGLGLAELQQGHLDAARIALERGLALDPRSAIAMLAMGMLSDGSGQHEAARSYYERARELQPINPEVENNLGVSYLLSREFAQAEVHLRRAIQLDPADTVQHNNLGLALGELGRFDEALESFRVASSEATARNNTGYLCYLKGDYSAAIQHYELALASAPTDRLPIIRNLLQAQDALDRSRAPAENTAPVPSPVP